MHRAVRRTPPPPLPVFAGVRCRCRRRVVVAGEHGAVVAGERRRRCTAPRARIPALTARFRRPAARRQGDGRPRREGQGEGGQVGGRPRVRPAPMRRVDVRRCRQAPVWLIAFAGQSPSSGNARVGVIPGCSRILQELHGMECVDLAGECCWTTPGWWAVFGWGAFRNDIVSAD